MTASGLSPVVSAISEVVSGWWTAVPCCVPLSGSVAVAVAAVMQLAAALQGVEYGVDLDPLAD
ncbi:hypothetical protein [Catenulispora pinisilvae]|uniref:hypothetical protein n=1 Tax=Catenulispora pinisilvae TaxID=2705253 RepID=UPI001E4E3A1F|nr:hypothetical protein [Catenulispora pinisilvae]